MIRMSYFVTLTCFFTLVVNAGTAFDENRLLSNMLDSAFTISEETIPNYNCSKISRANQCPKPLEQYMQQISQRKLVDFIILNSPYKKGGAAKSCSEAELSFGKELRIDDLEKTFKMDPYLSPDYTLYEVSSNCFNVDYMKKFGFKDYEAGIKQMSASYQYLQKRLEQGLIQSLLGLASLESHDFNFDHVLKDVNCQQLADKEAVLTCQGFKSCHSNKAQKKEKFEDKVAQSIDALIEQEAAKKIVLSKKHSSNEFKLASKKLNLIKQNFPWLEGKEFKKYRQEIVKDETFKQILKMREAGKIQTEKIPQSGLTILANLTSTALKQQFKTSADVTKARLAQFQKAMMCLQGIVSDCEDFQEIINHTPEINYNLPQMTAETEEQKNLYKNFLLKKSLMENQKCIHEVKGFQASDNQLMNDTFFGVSLMAFPAARVAMGLRGAEMTVQAANVLKYTDPLMVISDLGFTAHSGVHTYKSCKEDFNKLVFESMNMPPSCQMLGQGMTTVQREFDRCALNAVFLSVGGIGVFTSIKAAKSAHVTPKDPPPAIPTLTELAGSSKPSGVFTITEINQFEEHLKGIRNIKLKREELVKASADQKKALERDLKFLEESIQIRNMDTDFKTQFDRYVEMKQKSSRTHVAEDLDEEHDLAVEAIELAKKRNEINAQYKASDKDQGYRVWVGQSNKSFKHNEKVTVYIDLDYSKLGTNYDKVVDKITEILRKEDIPHTFLSPNVAEKALKYRVNKGKAIAFNPTEEERQRVVKVLEDFLLESKAKRSDNVASDLELIDSTGFFYRKRPIKINESDDPKEVFNHNRGGWVTDGDGKLLRYKGELIPADKETMIESSKDEAFWMYLRLHGGFK
ncbi:MAG: hypothetical protein AB7I27_02220 [Bacteriovoracaceae bacterium]